MIFAEWLRFTQGRSQLDQERMRMIMTRVLLRFRWLDRAGQIMFRGLFASYEQRGALGRKLEASVKGLDAARRSSYKDRIMLSQDCERLQEWNWQQGRDFPRRARLWLSESVARSRRGWPR